MSKLTKTLAVAALLAPVSAQSLGIGDLQVHSALNQKLHAEIRLHLAPGENASDIAVRLAPPEKFDQAGVPWNYFLSKIKFEPVVLHNGTVLVKVSSKETLTEPFLNFLLEVSWPQGSIFREFTVLVDPPSEYDQTPLPTVTQKTVDTEASDTTTSSARKTRTTATVSAPERDNSPNDTTSANSSGSEYGPVQANDTLWSIAQQLGRERNVSTQEMMNALYDANPDAFSRDSLESLMAGATLKIPDSYSVKKPARKSTKQASKPKQPASQPATTTTGKGLELVAPGETKIPDTSPVSTGKIKSDQNSNETTVNAPVSNVGNAIQDSKALELQSKIDKLEQQLNLLQQMVALKDQQLASIQNKDKLTTPPASEVAAPTATIPAAQPAPAEPTASVPPATNPTVVVPQTPPATPKPPKLESAAPKPVVTEAEEDFFSSNSYYISVAGIGGAVLSALGWLLWRKRQIDKQIDTESMFASASQIKMPDAESALLVQSSLSLNNPSSYAIGTVGESSFISEFTPSDFDAFDSDQNEIDPLSEADVYLAYGRYQQAEELIRRAISEQPDRDEYKLKLLEIFYANENKANFTSYAHELANSGKQTDVEFWTKVTEMAKELVPDLVFDSPAIALKTVVEQAINHHNLADDATELNIPSELPIEDDLSDLKTVVVPDLELMQSVDSELAELQLNMPNDLLLDSHELDFDLSSFSDVVTKQAPNNKVDRFASVDQIDLAIDTPTNKSTTEHLPNSIESFEFNFQEEVPPFESNLDVDLANLENFEFPDFESISSAISKPSTTSTSHKVGDDFDFSFDFDMPIAEQPSNVAGSESGVADLTDMDEFETKIDLAKAYVDMGDSETAKAIAEEVLEKGSNQQKEVAKALLDELK